MEKEETTVSRNVGAEELKCKLCVGKNGGASHDDDVVNLYGGGCPIIEEGKKLIIEWQIRKNLEANSKTKENVVTSRSIDPKKKKEKKRKMAKLSNSVPSKLTFIDHLLGGRIPDGLSSVDIIYINGTIWDARCFYTANLDLDRTEIPGAMLRMYQDSAGYRVESACKELQKKEDKKRRKREKKEANDYLWDEDRRCLVNFVKYNIVEGRRIMNEVPAGFLPLYECGEPLKYVFSSETSEAIPYVRYLYDSEGEGRIAPIPEGYTAHFTETDRVPKLDKRRVHEAQMVVLNFQLHHLSLNLDGRTSFADVLDGVQIAELCDAMKKLSIRESRGQLEELYLACHDVRKAYALCYPQRKTDTRTGTPAEPSVLPSIFFDSIPPLAPAGVPPSYSSSFLPSYLPSYLPSIVPTDLCGPYISE